jgi:ribosomal protein S18 acetylase RimI-like enzyme
MLRVGRSIAVPAGTSNPRITAELLSVGVLPTLRGVRGASGERRSVADALLNSALTALRARGVDTLHLVAKPVHVDPVPHRFVRKYGFTSAGPVRRFGIDAEMYELKLASSTQLEQPQ